MWTALAAAAPSQTPSVPPSEDQELVEVLLQDQVLQWEYWVLEESPVAQEHFLSNPPPSVSSIVFPVALANHPVAQVLVHRHQNYLAHAENI